MANWLKQIGDEVAKGEAVCEVETEKASAEIESPAAGRLVAILVDVGATVRVGDRVAHLESELPDDDNAGIAESAPPAALAVPTLAKPTSAPEPPTGGSPRVLSTPLARRIANENQVDVVSIAAIRGEPVRSADVLAVIESKRARYAYQLPPTYLDLAYTDEVLSSVRKAMGERMTRSAEVVVHMTSQVDVDMSAAEGARTEFNARQPDQMRTTALAFIARAATALLTSHPRLNASLIEGALRQWNTVNLGIAVDAPHGLIVPVIRGAGALGVSELAREIWRLATAARERRLRLEDVAGPTFTISNPGALGAVEAPAIIDLPQVATLGMAAIVRTPKVIIDSYGREAIAIRPILRAALTYDHRALNGGEAARYLTDLRNALESWSLDQYL